jgi:hypothetical protein
MSTKRTTCQHDADWSTAQVAMFDDDGVCSVALCCRHCDENAWADLGPEHFRWDDDDSPVAPPWDTPPTEPPPPRSRAS